MSVIKLPLLFTGSLGEKRLYTLFDSGANLSCIHPDFVEGLECPNPLSETRKIITASAGQFIEVTHRVTVDFWINDVFVSDEFLIVPGLTEEAVVGAVTMQKWRMRLDFELDVVHINPKVMDLKLM